MPLVDGPSVDIWVKASFDPTGRPEDIVEKRTDVHNGSKTGWGQFNYRMKFTLALPCEFPRLKIAIHDAGYLTDDAIGETAVNLKRTINKLGGEDSLEVPKTYLTCSHPNFPGEDRGVVMFSMTILTKEEADEEPVGEAQEEPNINPRLKRPSAGRGFGGINFSISLPSLSWNPFGNYIYVIGAIAVLGVLISAAFMLK